VTRLHVNRESVILPNIEGAIDGVGTDTVTFRYLEPGEGAVLSEAIRAAYGETYDVRWVYDPAEVEARLAAGTYVSWVAESAAGDLLCHEGMSLAAAGDAVGHSGQAVTMPVARGRHLFTRTKRHLMDWAKERGLAGMYSEATAAHPYSQRANLELGAHETGFLLGWIPASVSNDAATDRRPRRQSAALFYTKLNDGHAREVYAPERHHDMIRQTLELCELRGTLADPPPNARVPERTDLHVEIDEDHNLALLTAHEPGADLEQVVAAERHHLFHRKGLNAIYLDLPLENPATALLADHLERLGVSYAGVFPNNRTDGDVLRMQSLHRARITADDIEVASDHGRELLDYVLADLA
jgi:serine/threonine-protein kinase RsbW